jgi:hypothetical protein
MQVGVPVPFLYHDNMKWEKNGSSVEIRTQGELPDGRPALDEIVADGASIHLEQMAHDQWWMGIDAGGKTFHLNFGLHTSGSTREGCTLTFRTNVKTVPIGKATIGKGRCNRLRNPKRLPSSKHGGLIRGRTGTPFRVPEPKSGASANSAMRPRGVDSTRIASQATAKRADCG